MNMTVLNFEKVTCILFVLKIAAQISQVCKFDRQGSGCEMFQDESKSKGNM